MRFRGCITALTPSPHRSQLAPSSRANSNTESAAEFLHGEAPLNERSSLFYFGVDSVKQPNRMSIFPSTSDWIAEQLSGHSSMVVGLLGSS